jgi:quercetin dioxygenase-like cupin family protein
MPMPFSMNAGRAVLAVLCSSFLLAGSMVFAGEAKQQRAKVLSHDDPQLEWNSCPDFFPVGCEMTVVQGDPEKENADVLLKMPAGSEIPRHRHTSAERMILISGEFHITSEGQDTKVMKAGDYGFAPAGVPHEASCAPGDPCVLFIAFEEPVDAIPVD